MDVERLGERLREARQQAHMKQQEVADLLEVTASAISQYETGSRRVDAITLDRLARLYRVPVDFFFESRSGSAGAWEQKLRRQAGEFSTAARQGVGQLIERLRALQELFERLEVPVPEAPHPPFRALPGKRYGEQRVAEWVGKARRHFDLGVAPIRDVKAFMETQGFLVFALPLGDELSGLFVNHPALGPVVSVNSQEAFSRTAFTLSHELAHGLFHYDRSAILCRSESGQAVEQFADQFAGHFLVPQDELLERLWDMELERVETPRQVVRLARYFGISFGAMFYRLREEKRLDASDPSFRKVQPVRLARLMGFRPSSYEYGAASWPLEERLPRVYLELAYRAVEEDQLSLRRVAEMLGISDLELEERIYEQGSEPVETYA